MPGTKCNTTVQEKADIRVKRKKMTTKSKHLSLESLRSREFSNMGRGLHSEGLLFWL